MKITFGIDGSGIDKAIKQVEDYKRDIERKADEVCKRLAERGVEVAQLSFSSAVYDGNNDVGVTMEKKGNAWYAVVATGQATLFIEFGSGIIGEGHPQPLGYKPGSWSDGSQGKGHWKNPPWYYAHGKQSSGNPPSKSMYETRKLLDEVELARIAREVFG